MNTLSDYLYSKASRNRIPLHGTFELSPVCNFSCKMCYVRKTPGQIAGEGKRLKDWTEWLDLARQCREAGMLYLLLTGGEPFLYPNFRKLYTELHKMGFLVSINTNGSMIDEETVAWLKEYAPSRINLTVYGSSRETYQRICGNRDGYDRVCRAVDMLKEARIPMLINSSMIPENAEDLEQILQFGLNRKLNTRMATYMFPPCRRSEEESDSRFTPEQSAQMFLRKVKFIHDQHSYPQWLRKQCGSLGRVERSSEDWGTHREEYMRCRAGRSSFWVSWEGDMTACGIVPFPQVFNPFSEEFMSCWQQLTEKVRSTSVLAGCTDCTKREFCKPCVAMIQAETGDVNEKAPYLCQMTDCLISTMQKELEDIDYGQTQ